MPIIKHLPALIVFLNIISLLTSCQSEKNTKDIPTFKITSTSYLGSVWNEGHSKAFVVSQDGGSSFPIPEGTLWWFGDTFIGSRGQDGKPNFEGTAVSCSMAYLPKGNETLPPTLKYLTDKQSKVEQAIEYLSRESKEKYRIWPLGGIFINGNSYIYYSHIEVFGPSMWDFKSDGSGLAKSENPFSVHKRITTNDNWKFPVAPAQIILYDKWLYLFEIANHDGKQSNLWVSRVLPENIEDPSAYEYYTGKELEFSGDKNKQKLFLKDIYGQVSIEWNQYLELYVMATSSDFYNAREVWLRTSKKPYGPWSNPIAKIEVPEYCQGKQVELVYCSYLHPELFRENGRIMVLTCSLILKDSGFDANNEMIEVEISKNGL